MSLRLWITACSLSKIEKLAGGGDEVQRKQLMERLDEMLPDPDEQLTWVNLNPKETVEADAEEKEDRIKNNEDARNRINSLIDTGLVKSSESDTPGDVYAAYALALHAAANPQPWEDECETEEWSGAALYDLGETMNTRFDEKTLEYLTDFLVGRSFFGEGFDDNAGWYLFLSNAEICEFKSGLTRTFNETKEIVESGALNEMDFDSGLVTEIEFMIETLSILEKSKHDLFMLAD